jgi:hypothetical protein
MNLPVKSPSSLIPQTIRVSQVGWIPDAALANGIRILGTAGTGKTVLAINLLVMSFLRRWPYLVLDPTGSLITGFLARIQQYCAANRLSNVQQAQLYHRIVYVDLSGSSGYIMPFPLFRRLPGEPLSAIGDRVMSWILGMMPESKDAPVEGFTSIAKILRPAAIVLAALQLEITELTSLLTSCDKEKNEPVKIKEPWKARFAYLMATQPQEVGEAVSFFQNEFAKWDKTIRERRLNLIEVILQMFRYNQTFRATFGAGTPGLDYDQVISEGKIVLLDASRLSGEYKQLLLNWILLYSFTPYIWWRGSGNHPPIGCMIDEISTLYMDSPKAMELFSQSFGEIVHILRRQYKIHPLCVIHQNVAQLHPKMADHLAALGNQIIGKPADYKSSLLLAEQLFDYQPLIKRYEPIYMNIQGQGLRIIDYRLIEFRRDEILQLQAHTLMRLDNHKWLCRLTRKEGGGQGPLQQLDSAPLLGPYPDHAQVAVLRQQLARASGVSTAEVLKEIEARQQWVPAANPSVVVTSNATLAEHAKDPQDDDLSSLRETAPIT